MLDRAFQMPAGEVSASKRLHIYQVKRMKEGINRNDLVAKTEAKFRAQFEGGNDTTEVKEDEEAPIQNTQVKRLSEFNRSRFRLSSNKPKNMLTMAVRGIKDSTAQVANN